MRVGGFAYFWGIGSGVRIVATASIVDGVRSWRCPASPQPTRCLGRWSRPIKTIRQLNCPARRGARHRRIGAAGVVRLPAAHQPVRHRRRAVSRPVDQDQRAECQPGDLQPHLRRHRSANLRRHLQPDAAQRLFHRQPHAAGGATGVGGARDAAADRADRAAQRRHRLHEPDPRCRHPRPAAPQRRGAAGAASPDPRSLRRRRGHAHRRGAGGIAARRGARLDAVGGVELHHVAFDLSAGGRRRARQAFAGKPGRPAVAA